MAKSLKIGIGLLAAIAGHPGMAKPVSMIGTSSYRYTVQTIPLPGDGRGDYITADPATHRLYVTHSATLHILDLDTLKPVAQVDGMSTAHGVALDIGRGHGFVSDGGQDVVVMFDLATGTRLKAIPAGKKPDSILRDPATGLIFVFNGVSEDVSIIDPVQASVVATIKLPGNPEFSQADGKGKVWVNIESANAIAEIDTRSLKLVRTIKLAGCEGPAPLAFDAVNRLLFSGCGNRRMTVTDVEKRKVVGTVPIGDDPDGIVFDAGRKRIFVANRDGGWTIVGQRTPASYRVERTLPIDIYAKTIGLDPATHRVFSSTATMVWPPAKNGVRPSPTAVPGSFRLLVISEKPAR